jgi:hypothetical protein
MTLYARVQGQRTRMADIVERDGLWFVTQAFGSGGVYRPLEAPLAVPSLYLVLSRSDVRFFEREATVHPDTTSELEEVGTVVYRSPLPGPMREQLEAIVRTAESMGARMPESAQRSLAQARELLARGMETRFDPATGIVVQWGAPTKQTRLQGFRWLEQEYVKDALFETEPMEPGPLAAMPTAESLQRTVMIGHCAMWRPGGPECDGDTELLDLATGERRRVPFGFGPSSPGGFLPDRTRVVVSGLSMTGSMRPYLVDLRTRENRPLGGTRMDSGIAMFPVVSPDGRSVAVGHMLRMTPPFELELLVVDLATDEVRAVGAPMDFSWISWLPGGEGFLLRVREHRPGTEGSRSVVARMDMKGKLTPLLEGDFPVLLGDGKRVLFRSPTDRLWYTCDLKGKQVRRLGDGLPDHVSPGLAPDGKQLLFIHAVKGEAPRPILFNPATRQARPITDEPGLWSYPRGR